MSTKDLVEYVTNDLDIYYENMSDVEFIDEAKSCWDDGYDEVVEEDQRVHRLRFQKPIEDIFIDINNTNEIIYNSIHRR